jgi:hypothetical protein
MKGRNMRTLILIAALGLSAPLSAPSWADNVRLQENAPDRHVVVKGDTLWDISEKFLKDPWLWPEVWRLNKEEIKNPHLIYPGDVVVLTLEGGKPRLSLEKGRFTETVKLSPQVRSEPILIKEQGIPAIDPKHIRPFLNLAWVVDQDMLDAAPKLLGAVDERALVTKGDTVYASVRDQDTASWLVFRPGKQLLDPESKEVLGFEALNVGKVRTIVPGKPQTLLVEQASMEISIGDRLLPDLPIELESLTPHAPSKAVESKIILAYGGFNATSKHATVVINKGARDGIEAGHVLAIHRQGRVYQKGEDAQTHRYVDVKCIKPGKTLTGDFYDPKEMLQECKDLPQDAKQEAWRYMDVGCLKPGAKVSANEFFDAKDAYRLHCRTSEETLRLPDQRVGLLFVYRVYNKVAYGLIMEANGPVYLMDVVKNP